MTRQAHTAMGSGDLRVLADRGYFSGEEILACEQGGATPYAPKPLTSGAKADGRFGKADVVYLSQEDAYRCPARQTPPWNMTTIEHEMRLHRYWDLAICRACPIKDQCTPSLNRRITWADETVSAGAISRPASHSGTATTKASTVGLETSCSTRRCSACSAAPGRRSKTGGARRLAGLEDWRGFKTGGATTTKSDRTPSSAG